MRKHTARHWLHAVLDLLPVLLIPVFMIYSHRHDMTQQTTVDIQYKYQSNEVNSLDDIVEGNIYYADEEMYFYLGQSYTFTIDIIKAENGIELSVIDLDNESIDTDVNYTGLYLDFNNLYIGFGDYNICLFAEIGDFECSIYNPTFRILGNLSSFKAFVTEEGLLEFIHYTDYNEIESVDVQDTNSSVMNVFMDDFNNAINKYFNMGNVFGMTNVYQWFNTNIFGGNAPTIIYSVWNIVLYEFVMDLIFLLYALFMWFIDVTKRLIEKPLDSIK